MVARHTSYNYQLKACKLISTIVELTNGENHFQLYWWSGGGWEVGAQQRQNTEYVAQNTVFQTCRQGMNAFVEAVLIIMDMRQIFNKQS